MIEWEDIKNETELCEKFGLDLWVDKGACFFRKKDRIMIIGLNYCRDWFPDGRVSETVTEGMV